VDFERGADVLGQRVDPEAIPRPGAGSFFISAAEFVHLMTVDALLALAGLGGLEVLGENWLATGRRLLTGAGFMLGERLLGRVLQAGDRQPAVVALGVATAVATIDHLVGTQEKRVPRAIKVALKERQIGSSDTDE